MTDSLRVHVNRDGVKTVSSEASRIEVDGPFDLELQNHGQPAHVHVRMDDALAAVANLPDPNWYVEADEMATVAIDVESLDEVAGTLTIATGYGAAKTTVDVLVAAGSGGVQVDESLTKVAPDRDVESGTDESYLVPGVFVAMGVLVSAVVALLVDDTTAMALGIGVVVLAVAAALYLLLAD
ncbi:MAG: hypothetical protein ABEJ67_03050 [Halanaeroarchaeum sp.]